MCAALLPFDAAAAAQGQSTIYFYKSNVLDNTAGCGGVVALQVSTHAATGGVQGQRLGLGLFEPACQPGRAAVSWVPGAG